METPAVTLINRLREQKLTLGTVESATGGLIASLLTDIAGASDVFLGSIIAYSNSIKTDIVGVKPSTIEEYGAVSAPTAEEMAQGGRKLLGVDICLADTGIAGPGGGTSGKPVGLFYLGLASAQGTKSSHHVFPGDRGQNKFAAAFTALDWVNRSLEG